MLIDLPHCFSSTCTILSAGDLLQCPDMGLYVPVRSASCPAFQAELLASQSHAMAKMRPCLFANHWQTRLSRPLGSWVWRGFSSVFVAEPMTALVLWDPRWNLQPWYKWFQCLHQDIFMRQTTTAETVAEHCGECGRKPSKYKLRKSSMERGEKRKAQREGMWLKKGQSCLLCVFHDWYHLTSSFCVLICGFAVSGEVELQEPRAEARWGWN